jgi:hypothetical protein
MRGKGKWGREIFFGGRDMGRVLGVLVVGVLFPFAQIIAPLTHFVPEDTLPSATNALFTQTDQLFPSEEHKILP